MELVQRHEVRVKDVGQAPELALEPIEVRAGRLAQHLECDLGPALLIVGEIDDAEVAGGELAIDHEPVSPGLARRCRLAVHQSGVQPGAIRAQTASGLRIPSADIHVSASATSARPSSPPTRRPRLRRATLP